MIQFLIRLAALSSLLFLLACEEQQLRYPETWGQFELSSEELSDLVSIIEKEFRTDEEPWNNAIDYTDFSSHTLPGYTEEVFATIHFAPTYSTEKIRHFMAVECEKDLEKKEEWRCTKTPARAIHYAKNNTWVPIVGTNFTDQEGIHFFDTVSKMETIPVALGKDLIIDNITFSYVAEQDDKTLSAEIFDRKIGSSRILFSSKKEKTPRIAAIIKLTYDCVDQNYRTVISRFPCDYQQVQ